MHEDRDDVPTGEKFRTIVVEMQCRNRFCKHVYKSRPFPPRCQKCGTGRLSPTRKVPQNDPRQNSLFGETEFAKSQEAARLRIAEDRERREAAAKIAAARDHKKAAQTDDDD